MTIEEAQALFSTLGRNVQIVSDGDAPSLSGEREEPEDFGDGDIALRVWPNEFKDIVYHLVSAEKDGSGIRAVTTRGTIMVRNAPTA